MADTNCESCTERVIIAAARTRVLGNLDPYIAESERAARLHADATAAYDAYNEAAENGECPGRRFSSRVRTILCALALDHLTCANPHLRAAERQRLPLSDSEA